jgi:dolichol-phosphate mannosyltransferase
MDLTLVVSVYDEEEMLPLFIERARRLLDSLPVAAECLFVDDGSGDGSAALVAAAAATDGRLRLLSLSRNFGHEAAMIAGIDHARGESVICLDADLQHPLDEIPRMLAARAAGYDVVNMVRSEAGQGRGARRLLARLFYRLLNLISPDGFEPDASDFFLISRRVAKVLRTQYRERVRFLRGYIQTMGFRRTSLRYVVDPRAQGESKYSLPKLLNLSANALLSFSNLPLRLGVLLGGVVGALGVAVGAYSLVMKWLGDPPSGYTTIVVLVCFLFAVQFVITGVIGEYLGYVFAEVKGRPIYLVDEAAGAGARDAE